MKKTLSTILLVILAAAMLVSCSGAGGGGKESNVEGTLEELLAKVNEGAESQIVTYNTEVTADNAAYYLGTSDIAYKEALACEPMINAIAHSVVLIRMESGADIAAAKTKIKENVDPRKWICAGVEPDQVMVDSIGDLIILVMSVDAQNYIDAFKALA